jgi:hypothetical protein
MIMDQLEKIARRPGVGNQHGRAGSGRGISQRCREALLGEGCHKIWRPDRVFSLGPDQSLAAIPGNAAHLRECRRKDASVEAAGADQGRRLGDRMAAKHAVHLLEPQRSWHPWLNQPEGLKRLSDSVLAGGVATFGGRGDQCTGGLSSAEPWNLHRPVRRGKGRSRVERAGQVIGDNA